jgi:hypothetical protein
MASRIRCIRPPTNNLHAFGCVFLLDQVKQIDRVWPQSICAMLNRSPKRYKTKAARLVRSRWATGRFTVTVHQVNRYIVKLSTMPQLYNTLI